MENISCPQCKKETFAPTNRIVRDSCGHFKCRLCLLYETDGCITCYSSKSNLAVIDGPVGILNSICPTSIKNNDSWENHLAKSDKVMKVCTEVPVMSENSDMNSVINFSKDTYSKDMSRAQKLGFERSRTIGIKWPKNVCVEPIESSNQTVYSCNICKKKFRSRSHVAYHAYCGGRPKPFSCTFCQKGFSTKSDYKYHLQVHSGKRPYTCDVCEKSFYQRSKLKRHILLHTGVKAFICEDCGAAFNNAVSLNKHGLIHSGLKPYICDVCQKSFRDSSNLRKHERKHTNLMYTCAECGKQYVKKWSLIVHTKSHRDVRPYSCKQCNKTFYEKKDHQRHELIHTDIKQFRCKVCNSKFLRKDNLERHIRNTHPGIDSSTAIEKLTNSTKPKQIFKKQIVNVEYNSNSVTHNGKTFEDKDGSVVNKNSVVIEKNTSMASALKTHQATNMKNSIIEANNQRQSVIFSPVRCQSLTTENNINVQATYNKKTLTKAYESNGSINDNNNMKNPESAEKIITMEECEKVSTAKEKNVDRYANYIHKKVNYDMNKGFSKWGGRQATYPPDLSKLESYKNPEPVCTPESIELYKKILMPSYRSSEVAQSETENDKRDHGSNENSCKPSPCDIHWRRRMAHSSS